MSWFLFAFCSMLSYCIFSVCVKLSVARVDPTLMSTIQTWITGVFLVFITLVTVRQPIGEELISISKKDWGFILLSALAYCASWLFFFLALKHGPLAKIIAVERLDLIITIFLSALFFGEQITLKSLAGAALMLWGVFLITQE